MDINTLKSDIAPKPRGHNIGPEELSSQHGGVGRTAHFMAGTMGSFYHAGYGGPKASGSSGNEMSMKEAQSQLVTPSEAFHSSISGGMPGWDTSRAGMPVY